MVNAVLSSKGQVVIPQGVRKELGWKKGTRISIQKTPFGLMLFEIPKKPLSALGGMFKGSGLSVADLLAERRKDFLHDEKEFK